MDLSLVHIVFEVVTVKTASLLPYLYDAVHRFENYFKSACSIQSSTPCHICSEAGCCPYRAVFGQALSTDPEILRRHQKPPLPFVFKFRALEYDNSCIELGLVITGSAIQHISIFKSAVILMISSVDEINEADVTLSATWLLDYNGVRHQFNPVSHDLLLLSCLEILWTYQYADVVKISLESPLRLLNGGSTVHFFDFGLFMRSQLRRCSSLFAYYGEGELQLEYAFLSEAAARVTSLGDCFYYSKPNWSKSASHSGILGIGEFTDIADGIMPLLVLGSYFNAGKGAAYGMGAYRVEEL